MHGKFRKQLAEQSSCQWNNYQSNPLVRKQLAEQSSCQWILNSKQIWRKWITNTLEIIKLKLAFDSIVCLFIHPWQCHLIRINVNANCLFIHPWQCPLILYSSMTIPINWDPMMPRDASLSDSYMSDRCCFLFNK